VNGLLLTEIDDGVAVVTLNRPEARNALSSELLRLVPEAMAALEADDSVGVVVLTGTDPAFCAGLDLRELGGTGDNLTGAGDGGFRGPGFWPPMTKPVIGAVNGPAVTGGFEMALQCDFLVASDRARFGDTHARVGVIPGGGMSVLLPQAIGVRKAKQVSLTGRFLDAREALQWGLVTFVVPHEELLPFTRALAAEIVANDPSAVAMLLEEYKQASLTTVAEGWAMETANFRAFRHDGFDPAKVAARRQAVIEKGREQTT
jgi:enoyl-CoA hydratase